jgi:hypothetical protein
VIYKGFPTCADLNRAKSQFQCLTHIPIHVDDDKFDIGAYFDAALKIAEERICLLNTTSELITENWLSKLAINATQPGVAVVGATGSFESLHDYDSRFPQFPNIHLRSNAFMIDRKLFCSIAGDFNFKDKTNAFLFESGPNSMTRRIQALDLKVLIVGRNGRGYPPHSWPHSETFRQGGQSNLLIADNQTRSFDAAVCGEKAEFVTRTWGPYLQEMNTLQRRSGKISGWFGAGPPEFLTAA